jgi:eukaryotic-like serine/threonine-protein kinase
VTIGPGARDQFTADDQLGAYRLVDVLGRGGMGVVYRARHQQTGAVVALKTVSAIDGVHLSALRSEIRTLARLQHRGVVQILEEGLSAETPWFAMELVEGEPLSQRIDALWGRAPGMDKSTLVPRESERATGHWPLALDRPEPRPSIPIEGLPEMIHAIRQLCEALAYVHDQGIVHRDLKPSNVILRQAGGAVLIDFGLVSRHLAASGRERVEVGVGSRAGTRAYMAPEQLQREQVDARADLYALGCLIFELLTGHVPSDQEKALHALAPDLSRSSMRPSSLVAGVPGWLDDLVQGLLAKRPQERIGYAADVLDILDAHVAPPEGQGGQSPRRTHSRSYLYRPRMTGRAAEAAALLSRIEASRSSKRCATLYVGGESGCGKTMLVNELARQASFNRMTVIAGECRPIAGESTTVDPRDAPLHPFRPLLRAVADHCRAGGPAVARQILGPWAKLLARQEPALENIPGQEEMPESPALNGEAARDRLLGALRDILLAFASHKPLLLILDDLQWADELSLTFLRSFALDAPGGAPLVILGTFRSDELSPDLKAILDDPTSTCTALGRLDAGAVSSIVADMLGMLQPPPGLVAFLMRVSEGNPFFVAEYLRAAASEGILVRDAARWRLSSEGDANDSAYDRLRLPRSISGLVTRRLAGLSPDGQALASRAAVLGRSGEMAVLASMAERPEKLAEPLAEMVARQVLDVTAGRYSFVHDKIREAALEQIAEADRPALELQAADAIERTSEDPDPFQLASLYRSGGRADKAYRYAQVAATRALEAGAFREARVHLQTALAIAESQSGAVPELEQGQRGRLRLQLGEALVVSGDLQQGIDTLHRACEELGLPAPARTRIGWVALALREIVRWALAASWTGRWLRVTDEKERALWIAGSNLHRLVSMAYLFLVRPLECLGALFLSGRLAEEAQADGQRAATRSFAAGVCGLVGLRRLQERLFATARTAARATDDVLPLLWQASSEAIFYHHARADWAEIERCTAPALVRAHANHLIYDCHPVEFAAGMGEFEQGKLAEAQARFERIFARAETLGHQQYVVSARGALVLCDLYAGQLHRVVETSQSVMQLHSGDKDVDLFIVLTCVASAKLRLGDSAGADEMARRAWSLVQSGAQLEGRPLAVRVLYDLADVVAALWQESLIRRQPSDLLAKTARRILRKLVRLAGRYRYLRPGTLLIEARVRALRGQIESCKRSLERACDEAVTLRMLPFEAFARFELARSPVLADEQRLAHVTRAVDLFERMGCAWHLDHALALERHIGRFQGRNLP